MSEHISTMLAVSSVSRLNHVKLSLSLSPFSFYFHLHFPVLFFFSFFMHSDQHIDLNDRGLRGKQPAPLRQGELRHL